MPNRARPARDLVGRDHDLAHGLATASDFGRESWPGAGRQVKRALGPQITNAPSTEFSSQATGLLVAERLRYTSVQFEKRAKAFYSRLNASQSKRMAKKRLDWM